MSCMYQNVYFYACLSGHRNLLLATNIILTGCSAKLGINQTHLPLTS